MLEAMRYAGIAIKILARRIIMRQPTSIYRIGRGVEWNLIENNVYGSGIRGRHSIMPQVGDILLHFLPSGNKVTQYTFTRITHIGDDSQTGMYIFTGQVAELPKGPFDLKITAFSVGNVPNKVQAFLKKINATPLLIPDDWEIYEGEEDWVVFFCIKDTKISIAHYIVDLRDDYPFRLTYWQSDDGDRLQIARDVFGDIETDIEQLIAHGAIKGINFASLGTPSLLAISTVAALDVKYTEIPDNETAHDVPWKIFFKKNNLFFSLTIRNSQEQQTDEILDAFYELCWWNPDEDDEKTNERTVTTTQFDRLSLLETFVNGAFASE